MTVEKKLKNIDQTLQTISNTLDDYSTKLANKGSQLQRLTHHFEKIRDEQSNFQNNLTELEQRDNLLRIGIVGQVKAGKSSFLNALLFEGQDVLPKAATPMTAALTVVKHGKKFSAEVDCYAQEDWELIEKKAEAYTKAYQNLKKQHAKAKKEKNLINKIKTVGLPPLESLNNHPGKPAQELIELAQAQGIVPSQYYGKTIKLEASSLSELNKEIMNYVGADGKFTPIVKSSTLTLNIRELEGIELVDTPGINDPIISRGEATLQYLGMCDAIFMLSYSGQFLDHADLELFAGTIPSKAIKHMVLLGSKIDTIFLQDNPKQYNNLLTNAARGTVEKLSKQASNTLQQASAHGHPAAENLYKHAFPPKFISGLLHSAALKMEREEPLDKNETHILDQLKKRFNDAEQFLNSPKMIRAVAGIDRLGNEEFATLREKKEAILKERKVNMSTAHAAGLNASLVQLAEEADRIINGLESDPEHLEAMLKKFKKQKVKLTKNISILFAEKALEIKNEIQMLSREGSSSVQGIDASAQTRSESYTVSTSSWYNPFSWGRSETRHRTVEYIKPARIINDLRSSMNAFEQEATQKIQEQLTPNKLDVLAKNIFVANKDILIDENDIDTNVTDYILEIKSIVSDLITAPQISINISKQRKMIMDEFGGETTNISAFQSAFYDIQDTCKSEIQDQLKAVFTSYKTLLDKKAEEFVTSLSTRFEDKIHAVTKPAEEKAQVAECCEAIKTIIKNYK